MNTKKYNYKKGRLGESLAKNYLMEKGFVFIESNFEVDIGELDIIMSVKDWLVFVEVKYKYDDRMGLPEEMLDRRKITQIKRVAEIYLMKNKDISRSFSKYRIDAVCILGTDIRHYENIF
jgi:putative endonuclease